MGFFDAIKRLTKPYTDDEEGLMGDYDETPARTVFPRHEVQSYESYATAPAPEPQPSAHRSILSAIPNMRSAEGKAEPQPQPQRSQPMQLVVMRPERFEDAAGIAEQMRRRASIVLNLEALPRDSTLRMVDFLSGAAIALQGHIRRISAGTYIITPANVDLTGVDIGAFETAKENYF